MTYDKKLTLAKILVSVGLCLNVLMSLGKDYGALIALPIMLWAIWGKKLHGTGRSVRLMAFIGIAFTLGVFIADALSDKSGADFHDTVNARLIFGLDSNLAINGTILVMLVLGVFLSIRRAK